MSSSAEATKEAQKAGIAHAKANPMKYRGRKPSYTENQISEVIALIGEGKKVGEISKQLGLSRQAIYRIQKNPVEAIANATAWI